MANVNNPFGGLPAPTPLGSGSVAQVEIRTLISTNVKIGIGDPIKYGTDGKVDKWTAGASAPIIGFAASWADANSGADIYVYTDPQQLYIMQCDGTTGVLTSAAGKGLNADMVLTATTGRQSLVTIDESSGTADATKALYIVDLYRTPKNTYGQYNVLVVRLNSQWNRLEKPLGIA